MAPLYHGPSSKGIFTVKFLVPDMYLFGSSVKYRINIWPRKSTLSYTLKRTEKQMFKQKPEYS